MGVIQRLYEGTCELPSIVKLPLLTVTLGAIIYSFLYVKDNLNNGILTEIGAQQESQVSQRTQPSGNLEDAIHKSADELDLERYANACHLSDAKEFVENRISPEVAKSYRKLRECMGAWEIIKIVEAGITPDVLKLYTHLNIHTTDIIDLVEHDISPEVAARYIKPSKRIFSGWDIVNLVEENVSPETAFLDKYQGINGGGIVRMEKEGRVSNDRQ